MNASVIIPVRNDWRVLRCLAALRFQTHAPGQVIVVDNGNSADLNQAIADLPGVVELVTERRVGSYWARNRGLEVAAGEIIAFTDADCMPVGDWLGRLLAPFESSQVAGAAGSVRKLLGPGSTWVQCNVRSVLSQPYYLPPFRAPCAMTANAAYRMSVLQDVGGFDPAFQSGGDADLAIRVWAKGYKVVGAPDAVVYHAPRRTVWEYFKQHFGYSVGRAQVFKKHGHLISPRQLFLDGPFTIQMLKLAQGGNPLEAVRLLALMLGNVYGAWKWKLLWVGNGA